VAGLVDFGPGDFAAAGLTGVLAACTTGRPRGPSN